MITRKLLILLTDVRDGRDVTEGVCTILYKNGVCVWWFKLASDNFAHVQISRTCHTARQAEELLARDLVFCAKGHGKTSQRPLRHALVQFPHA
jgi:hypothetical protein